MNFLTDPVLLMKTVTHPLWKYIQNTLSPKPWELKFWEKVHPHTPLRCHVSQVICCMSNTEFLKAEIMQSHDYAKYLRICANFGLVDGKHKKLAQILWICHHSFTCFFLCNVNGCPCARFSISALWLRQKVAFRKSGQM